MIDWLSDWLTEWLSHRPYSNETAHQSQKLKPTSDERIGITGLSLNL